MKDDRRNHAIFLLQIALNALSGYVFVKVLAVHFGTSAIKDGFDIAYSVPFIVMNISGFLFIQAIVTTRFAEMLVTKPQKVEVIFSALLTWMILLSLALMLCCVLFAKQVIAVLGPGLSPDVKAQTQQLVVWLLPLVPTLGISTFLSATLNAYAVPVAAEFCQLIARVGAIGYMLWLGSALELQDVALGLFAASLLGLAVQSVALVRTTGLRFRFRLTAREPVFGRMLRQAAAFLVVAIAAQASWAYMRRLATLDGVGTTASITYAMAIISPASLILGKPLALTLGPKFATNIARGESDQARSALFRAVVPCVLLGIVVAAGVNFFSRPLIALVFGGGRFDAQAVEMTAGLCRLFILGLPAVIINIVILMPILACRDSHFPPIVLGTSYLVHLMATAMLFPLLGRNGLAYGYLVYVNFQALLGVLLVVPVLRDSAKAQRTEIDGQSDAMTRRACPSSKHV